MSEGRILVVDDDFLIRESLSELLRLEGYDVDVAPGGHEALAALGSRTYDLVFTDINMPGVTGFDVLREVNLKYPETKVVLITGFGEIQTAVQAIKQGAYDYVQKPLVDDDIKMLARRVMEQRALSEENRYLRQRLGMRPKIANFVGQDPKIKKIFEIIEAIVENRNEVFAVIVPNRGAIPNLPDDVPVEVSAVVGRNGIFPLQVGPLPEPVAANLRKHADFYRMIAEAALAGDRKLALDALLLDPLSSAVLTLEQAERLLDEMMEVEAEFLPQFR